MSLRRAAKRDANEPAIVAALRAVGATVDHISDTDVPDLDVGYKGINFRIEIKMPKKRLTLGQAWWHAHWQGHCDVAWNIDDVLRIVGAIE